MSLISRRLAADSHLNISCSQHFLQLSHFSRWRAVSSKMRQTRKWKLKLEEEEMEFSIGPAYIWMSVCVALLLLCLLLISLICCFCCSQKRQKKKRLTKENTTKRLGGNNRLPVHRPQDLEEEEQALAITRSYSQSFSTFKPKPLPAKSDPQDFPELRAVSARGASTSAPSLMLDGSFRWPPNPLCKPHLPCWQAT